MDTIEVKSTSRQSATCTDVVVRRGPQSQLVFRPEIVDNRHDAAATIRGTFLYQRKGKADSWEDAPSTSLARLKKGEGYKLELKSGELLPLLRELSALYRLSRKEGIPQGKQRYVRLERNLAEFLALSQSDLDEFLAAHQADALSTLHKVLRWLANSTALADFIGSKGDEISVLNAMLGVAGLRTILELWKEHQGEGDEDYWQDVLGNHAFVLSQVFAYPVVVVGQKAYVGGKRLDNRHGHLADFLASARATGNTLIVEIKTPATRLLAKEYRDGAFPPSRDLAGALSQVIQYQESLGAELSNLTQGLDTPLASQPRCMVVIGNSQAELGDDARRRSFERFRERLTGVTVITFDELFGRVAELERLLTTPG